MSLFEEVMSIAVQLPVAERERLAQALGVKVASSEPPRPTGTNLPLHSFASRPDAVAWRKAETGHAVLATEISAEQRSFPPGPAALSGMWAHHAGEEQPESAIDGTALLVTELPKGSPVVVHTDVCIALALGVAEAIRFFEASPVEVRLATATYLTLLDMAEDKTQLARIRHFVQPFAVLSLGPMASSRAVELMMNHALESGLHALDALIAATALAHEISLVTRQPRPFAEIAGLTVCQPY